MVCLGPRERQDRWLIFMLGKILATTLSQCSFPERVDDVVRSFPLWGRTQLRLSLCRCSDVRLSTPKRKPELVWQYSVSLLSVLKMQVLSMGK